MTVEELQVRRAVLNAVVSIIAQGPQYGLIGICTGEVQHTDSGTRVRVEFVGDEVGWFRPDEVLKVTCQVGRR